MYDVRNYSSCHNTLTICMLTDKNLTKDLNLRET